jgi:hypothetical protein
MIETVIAQTQAQVNSWPRPQSPTMMSGERVYAVSDGELSPAQKEQEKIQIARERFKVASDAEAARRREFLEDIRFSQGIQWAADIEQRRRQQGRPCLTINRIEEFLAHVVNTFRQARPDIKVQPIGDGADEEQAEVRQGLIRHIENVSNSDAAYDMAFWNMCCAGLGWLRIVNDWSDPKSFDQDLFIRWIPNIFSVYSDPFTVQPDWSDMKWAFVVEDLTPKEFRMRFPKKKIVSNSDFQSTGDHAAYWIPGGKIRIAEYFHVEEEDGILLDIGDGDTILLSDMPKADQASFGAEMIYAAGGEMKYPVYLPSTTVVYNHRECITPTVYWSLMSGVEMLDERKWKGSFIPLIPVIGKQTYYDGNLNINGMVRYAREPQRMYNYMYSCFVETVALAPKAPFIAEVDQVPDGIREEWENANTQPTALLRYKSKLIEGTQEIAPPPQRQQAEPPIQAFVAGLQMADQNLKSTFRIYDASLGQRGPQESGLAINARKIESDTGVYNWGDNFIQAYNYLGRQLNEQLEFYYNNPGRIMRLIGEDNTTRSVTMNQPFQDQGDMKHFDLRKGKFSVVISTGPTYQTRRQEAQNAMMEILKANPALFNVIGDIAVKEMDFPGKDAIASRLQKAMPPGIRDAEPGQTQLPPEVQGQMQQMQAMIQQLTAALHEASDKMNLERMKQEYETYRTQLQQEVSLANNQLKVGSDEAKFMNDKIFAELERVRQRLDSQLGVATGTDPNAAPGQNPQLSSTGQPPQPSSAPVTDPGIGSVGQ